MTSDETRAKELAIAHMNAIEAGIVCKWQEAASQPGLRYEFFCIQRSPDQPMLWEALFSPRIPDGVIDGGEVLILVDLEKGTAWEGPSPP